MINPWARIQSYDMKSITFLIVLWIWENFSKNTRIQWLVITIQINISFKLFHIIVYKFVYFELLKKNIEHRENVCFLSEVVASGVGFHSWKCWIMLSVPVICRVSRCNRGYLPSLPATARANKGLTAAEFSKLFMVPCTGSGPRRLKNCSCGSTESHSKFFKFSTAEMGSGYFPSMRPPYSDSYCGEYAPTDALRFCLCWTTRVQGCAE